MINENEFFLRFFSLLFFSVVVVFLLFVLVNYFEFFCSLHTSLSHFVLFSSMSKKKKNLYLS